MGLCLCMEVFLFFFVLLFWGGFGLVEESGADVRWL